MSIFRGFFASNSYTLFHAFNRPEWFGCVQLICEYTIALLLILNNQIVVTLSQTDTLLFEKLFSSIPLPFNSEQSNSLITIAMLLINSSIMLMLMACIIFYYAYKKFSNARIIGLSFLVKLHLPLFLIVQVYVSITNFNGYNAVNLPFAILIGYMSARSQTKFNYQSHLLFNHNNTDSLAILQDFSSLKQLISSLIFAGSCGILESTYPHTPPIFGIFYFSFRAFELFRSNPYANRSMHLLDLQLALTFLIWTTIISYSINVSPLKYAAIAILISTPLAFKLGTIISNHMTIRITQAVNQLIHGQHQKTIMSSLSPLEIDQITRFIWNQFRSQQYQQYLQQQYSKSPLKQPTATTILQSELAFNNHMKYCLRTDCFCSQNPILLSHVLVEEHTQRESFRSLKFTIDLILSLFTTHVSFAKEFSPSLLSFLHFVQECASNEPMLGIKLIEIRQAYFSQMSSHSMSIVNHMISSTVTRNKVSDIFTVLEFDNDLTALETNYVLALSGKEEFIFEIARPYIDLESLENKGKLLLGNRKNLEINIQILLGINPKSLLLQHIAASFQQNLALDSLKILQPLFRFSMEESTADDLTRKLAVFSQHTSVLFVSLRAADFAKIVNVSRSFRSLFQYEKRDVINKNCSYLMPKYIANVHDTLLRRYVQRGTFATKHYSSLQPFFMLNKTGFIIPIRVQLQLSVFQADSIGISGLVQTTNKHEKDDSRLAIADIQSNFMLQGCTQAIYEDFFCLNSAIKSPAYLTQLNLRNVFPILPLLVASITHVETESSDTEEIEIEQNAKKAKTALLAAAYAQKGDTTSSSARFYQSESISTLAFLSQTTHHAFARMKSSGGAAFSSKNNQNPNHKSRFSNPQSNNSNSNSQSNEVFKEKSISEVEQDFMDNLQSGAFSLNENAVFLVNIQLQIIEDDNMHICLIAFHQFEMIDCFEAKIASIQSILFDQIKRLSSCFVDTPDEKALSYFTQLAGSASTTTTVHHNLSSNNHFNVQSNNPIASTTSIAGHLTGGTYFSENNNSPSNQNISQAIRSKQFKKSHLNPLYPSNSRHFHNNNRRSTAPNSSFNNLITPRHTTTILIHHHQQQQQQQLLSPITATTTPIISGLVPMTTSIPTSNRESKYSYRGNEEFTDQFIDSPKHNEVIDSLLSPHQQSVQLLQQTNQTLQNWTSQYQTLQTPSMPSHRISEEEYPAAAAEYDTIDLVNLQSQLGEQLSPTKKKKLSYNNDSTLLQASSIPGVNGGTSAASNTTSLPAGTTTNLSNEVIFMSDSSNFLPENRRSSKFNNINFSNKRQLQQQSMSQNQMQLASSSVAMMLNSNLTFKQSNESMKFFEDVKFNSRRSVSRSNSVSLSSIQSGFNNQSVATPPQKGTATAAALNNQHHRSSIEHLHQAQAESTSSQSQQVYIAQKKLIMKALSPPPKTLQSNWVTYFSLSILLSVSLVIVVTFMELSSLFTIQKKNFYYISWGMNQRNAISRIYKNDLFYVLLDFPELHLPQSPSEIAQILSNNSWDQYDTFREGVQEIQSETTTPILQIVSTISSSDQDIKIYFDDTRYLTFSTSMLNALFFISLKLFEINSKSSTDYLNASLNRLHNQVLYNNFLLLVGKMEAVQSEEERSIGVVYDEIESVITRLLLVICSISAFFVAATFPVYSIKQKKKQRILSLFATIDPMRINILHKSIRTALSSFGNSAAITTSAGAAANAVNDKRDKSASMVSLSMMLVDSRQNISKKSRFQSEKTSQQQLQQPQSLFVKAKKISATNQLHMHSIELFSKGIVIYALLIVYPVVNYITTRSLVTQSNNNQVLAGILQTMKAQVSSNMSNLIIMMNADLNPTGNLKFFDTLVQRFNAVQTALPGKLSLFSKTISEQSEYERAYFDEYNSIFFRAITGNTCEVMRNRASLVDASRFTIDECENDFEGLFKKGIKSPIETFSLQFTQTKEIFELSNREQRLQYLSAFLESNNVWQMNRMYERIAEVFDGLNAFLVEKNSQFFERMSLVQTVLMVFQFAMLFLIFRFGLLSFYRSVSDDLIHTKNILSLFSIVNLIENQYIMNYLSK